MGRAIRIAWRAGLIGVLAMAGSGAPGMAAMSVQTTHHERPLLMHTGGASVRVEPGPFRDHKDAELVILRLPISGG